MGVGVSKSPLAISTLDYKISHLSNIIGYRLSGTAVGDTSVAILFSDTDSTLSIYPNIAHASYSALALSTLRSVGICKFTVLASFQSFVRRGVSSLPPILLLLTPH